MYNAYRVLATQLKDQQAAGAACEAGWLAYNAPHLAWCAGHAAYYNNHLEDAKGWAEKAVAVGCFEGTCTALNISTAQHHDGLWQISHLDSLNWEGPYDVLQHACKALGDAVCAARAEKRHKQAEYARRGWGQHISTYMQTKVSPGWLGWLLVHGQLDVQP
jgi:hypothetical protein